MSQHPMTIANQAGASFRADLNSQTAAIVSQSSGATAPSTTYAYMFWADTTTGLLKQRNGANSGWVTVGGLADWGIASVQTQTSTAFTTAGTSTAYTVTTSPVASSLVANQRYRIKLHTPNGASPALVRDGLASVAFMVYNSAGAKVAPAAAALPTLCDVEYDGTHYVVLNQLPVVTSVQEIINVVEATPYTTYTSTGLGIPNDNTIPQITEGLELMTVAITPTSATSRLRIEFLGNFGGGSGSSGVAALFQDAVSNALTASSNGTYDSVNMYPVGIAYEMAAGTTSAITFRVRVGSVASTLYINGTSAERKFGGVTRCTLRVTEIAA